MRRDGTATAVAVAAASAVAGAVTMARRVDARWAAADDPCTEADRLLPAGESFRLTTDDGAELAGGVSGRADGPTVVLAHCWTGGREVWAPVAHRLIRSGHQVVLYDQRGHGSSTAGDDGFTIPRLGADLRAVMEHVDARDAVVAGHSMGGMTISSLATHHPDVVAGRARALVFVATAAAGLSRGSNGVDVLGQRVISARSLERLLRSKVGHAFVRATVGAAVRRNHLTVTRDLFVACAPEVRAGWLAAMQEMDLLEGIASIGVPTTVLVGTHDRLTPPRLASQLVDAVPGAKLVTLERRGHMLPLEAPDEVAAAIASAAAP